MTMLKYNNIWFIFQQIKAEKQSLALCDFSTYNFWLMLSKLAFVKAAKWIDADAEKRGKSVEEMAWNEML